MSVAKGVAMSLMCASRTMQSTAEEVLSHHSFEDTVELVDMFSHCVVLYDYVKVNPNDMELE